MESGTSPPEQDTEFITKTVTSSLNIQEYFAQRMVRLKAARGADATAPLVEAEAKETSSPAKELSPVNSNDGTKEPKRKKKKKNSKSIEDLEVVEDKCIDPPVVVVVDDDNQEEVRSKKKKKKRKTAEHDNNANESCRSSNVLENCQELCSSRKTKLKKRELLNGDMPTENKAVESVLTLDEKRNHKQDDVGEEYNALVVKKSKKKKKKKKHQE